MCHHPTGNRPLPTQSGEDRAGSSAPRPRQLTEKEDHMDADQLKCKWIQFKRALKTRWGRFKDEHLVQSEGSYAKFVDKAHGRLMKGADQRHQQSAPEAVGKVSH